MQKIEILDRNELWLFCFKQVEKNLNDVAFNFDLHNKKNPAMWTSERRKVHREEIAHANIPTVYVLRIWRKARVAWW